MFLEDLSKFSLQSLRVFSYVALFGSVAKAAEAMQLTQPAVSLQIHNLEEVLGFSLFERKGRQNVLTARGQIFLRQVLPQLEMLEQVLIEAAKSESSSKAKLSIGSVEGIGEYWISSRFNRFANKYDSPRLFLEIQDSSILQEHLITGRLQLIITPHRFEHAQVVSQVFMDEQLMPVGHPTVIQEFSDIVEEARKKKDVQLLEQIHWVGYGDPTHIDPWASRWMESNEFVVKKRLRYQHHVNSYSVIKNLLLQGRGVCVAPAHTCETELESGDLISFESKKFPALKNRLYVSYRTESLNVIHREFLDWILGEAAKHE